MYYLYLAVYTLYWFCFSEEALSNTSHQIWTCPCLASCLPRCLLPGCWALAISSLIPPKIPWSTVSGRLQLQHLGPHPKLSLSRHWQTGMGGDVHKQLLQLTDWPPRTWAFTSVSFGHSGLECSVENKCLFRKTLVLVVFPRRPIRLGPKMGILQSRQI